MGKCRANHCTIRAWKSRRPQSALKERTSQGVFEPPANRLKVYRTDQAVLLGTGKEVDETSGRRVFSATPSIGHGFEPSSTILTRRRKGCTDP